MTNIQIPTATTKLKIIPGKGQAHQACICNHNIDITTGGCPVALNKDAAYESSKRCQYCYAMYVHKKGFVKNKTIDPREWDKAKLELPVIRIGKMVEPGGRESRELLVNSLELNNKHNLKTILVTKILDWDPEVSKLLKVHNSTLHISMGYDNLEEGAANRGFDNEARLKVARRYHKAGNNVYLRIVVDITSSIPKNIKAWEKYGIPFLITPLRFFKKDLIQLVLPEESWESLIESKRYKYKNALIPIKMHSDWSKHKERCGYIGSKFHCNNCGLGKL
ncbi:hypothetical protein HN682_09495 [Candidatus Peregrinibacteria bacterium]|jgi:DNA repair photolyase|nr:hypothetical protein [Candidatus Peregrinibacteria bacterium]